MSNTVYLTRHGQSIYNIQNRIGGDSNISDYGQEYSKKLFEYIKANENIDTLKVYTSQLIRTKQTSQHFPNHNKVELELLNEINAGEFENMTYQDIKNKHSDEYNKRKVNKFTYRYPKGESYKDLQDRVSGIIKIIHQDFFENKTGIVVCHNAVLRIIYGLFLNISDNEIPHLNIPLHTLFKFEHDDNKYKLTMINLDPRTEV